MQESLYCGIDLHKKFSVISIVNQEGEVINTEKVTNVNEEIESFVKRWGRLKCAFETTSNWFWLSDLLEGLGQEVHLANLYKTRLIAGSMVKTDKIDSVVLAQLLRTKYLPECYRSNMEEREKRLQVRHRARLIKYRTQLKNAIHKILMINNISTENFTDLFGKKGLEWLRQVELRPYQRKIIDRYLGLIEGLNNLLKEISVEYKEDEKENELINLLMTIPGIGINGAELIIAEVGGNIKRFAKAKKFAGYCGLGVRENSSGEKIRKGQITKQGSKWLRCQLIESALQAKRVSPNLRNFYNRIAYRRGKQKAAVALARKLSEIIWSVLYYQTQYDENKVRRQDG